MFLHGYATIDEMLTWKDAKEMRTVCNNQILRSLAIAISRKLNISAALISIFL